MAQGLSSPSSSTESARSATASAQATYTQAWTPRRIRAQALPGLAGPEQRRQRPCRQLSQTDEFSHRYPVFFHLASLSIPFVFPSSISLCFDRLLARCHRVTPSLPTPVAPADDAD